MTWRGRRRGSSRGRRASSTVARARATSMSTRRAIVLNGVVVAGFGVVVTALYVDVSAGELALFAACSAAGYVVESLVAGHLPAPRRRAGPGLARRASAATGVTARMVGGRVAARWRSLRRPSLYAIGAIGCGGAGLVLAALLDLPAERRGAAASRCRYLLYVSSVDPALHRARAGDAAACSRRSASACGSRRRRTSARVSLHRRLLVTVPMVTWGAGVIVAGLVTDGRRANSRRSARPASSRSASARRISMWLEPRARRCRLRPDRRPARRHPPRRRRRPRRARAGRLAPTRPASSPRRSTRWSPGSASARSCTRRSARSSTRR